jgi:hypothetical protein
MASNKEVITDPALIYRSMDTCPTGPKVLLLNRAGIAQTWWWDGKDDWYIGWHPLPKIPPGIRELIEPTYRPTNIGQLIGD